MCRRFPAPNVCHLNRSSVSGLMRCWHGIAGATTPNGRPSSRINIEKLKKEPRPGSLFALKVLEYDNIRSPAAPIRVIQPRLAKPKPPPGELQRSRRYHCVLCDLKWVHDFTEPLSCPGCHILQHEFLFSRFLKCWFVRPVPRVSVSRNHAQIS